MADPAPTTASDFRPVLDLQIVSPAGDYILARTTDGTPSLLRLTLRNAGPPVWFATGGDNPSQIVFNFGNLLTGPEIAELDFSAPGWVVQGWAGGTATTRTMIRSPEALTGETLAKDQTLDIRVTVPKAGARRNPRHAFTVTCRNLHDGGTPPRRADRSITAPLILADSPQKPRKDLAAVVACLVEPGQIECWPDGNNLVDNTIRLGIANLQKDKPLIPAGFEAKRPSFTVVFPTVPDGGESETLALNALTTTELGSDVKIAPKSGMHGWIATRQEEGTTELTPMPANGADKGNAQGLGPGESLVIEIADLRTPLPPFLSRLYVLYRDIADYDDGYFAVPLWKKLAPPQIKEFKIDRLHIDYGGSCTLSWVTVGGLRIELFQPDPAAGRGTTWSSDNTPGTRALRVTRDQIAIAGITRDTTFTLTLFHAGGSSIEQVAVTVDIPELTLTVAPDKIRQGGAAIVSWALSGSMPLVKDPAANRLTNDRSAAIAAIAEAPWHVTAVDTTTYTLDVTVEAPIRLPLQKHATLQVMPPEVVTFKVCRGKDATSELHAGEIVDSGTTLTLVWETRYASSLVIDWWDEEGHHGTSTIPATGDAVNGSMVINPVRTTHYQLACEGREPLLMPIEKVVLVRAVSVTTFQARRRNSGGPADHLTLGWIGERVVFDIGVTYATSLHLSHDRMGTVDVWAAGGPGAPIALDKDGKASFQVEIQVLCAGTFTLLAAGPAGPVTRKIAVDIAVAPRITQLEITARERDDGSSYEVSLAWTTLGANNFWLGCVSRDRLPFPSDRDGDEHPLDRCFDRVVTIEIEGPGEDSGEFGAAIDRPFSGMTTWQSDDPVTDSFLDQNVFYLFAKRGSGGMPTVQTAPVKKVPAGG